MTPAEFRTIREACGLTQQSATEFFGVALRTIQHWESGRNAPPQGAIDGLLSLDHKLEQAAEAAVAQANDASEKYGKPELIDLYRYRNEEDLWTTHPEMEPLPVTAHAAILARAKRKLEAAGYTVRIAYAD